TRAIFVQGPASIVEQAEPGAGPAEGAADHVPDAAARESCRFPVAVELVGDELAAILADVEQVGRISGLRGAEHLRVETHGLPPFSSSSSISRSQGKAATASPIFRFSSR